MDFPEPPVHPRPLHKSPHERTLKCFRSADTRIRNAKPKARRYHCDAGDLLPETRAVVGEVEGMLPRFVRIRTDARHANEDNQL